MRAQTSIWLMALMVASSAGVAGWWIYRRNAPDGPPPGLVAASGRLEGRTATLSAAVGGRILDLPIREGDLVEEGAVVARLDPRLARATVEAARADVAAARAAVEAERDRTRDVDAQLDLAQRELARVRALQAEEAASRQSLEAAETTVARFQSAARAARAVLSAASRRVQAAEAQLAAARVQLDETAIEAPHRGVIDVVIARHGEVVGPGTPIASLLACDSMRLRVFLSLLDAERVQRGDEARVFVDSLPGRVFEGRVEWISGKAEFTPRDVHMPDERTSLVFAVDVRIPNAGGTLKDGFPADAYIRWRPETPWPEKPPW